ncbi:MAG: anaerobic ribonucleoside-triphosphate reductase activating protein [Treponema sp.]|nr:anaerobic ribonucleoside-triphosphate reductase activating protein [Treponema sp.]
MFYGTIKKFDVADGEGVRVSLFVSGCRNCCAGCFQPQTWDFNFGNEFTEETQNEIIKALEPPHIQGFSLLGGEPFEPENQQVLAPFLKKLKEIYPKKDIWCWTGYIFEKDLQPGGKRYIPEYTELMLNCIDVLVDGPFIQEKKNLMLRFRGSENQRLLHLKDGEIQKIE